MLAGSVPTEWLACSNTDPLVSIELIVQTNKATFESPNVLNKMRHYVKNDKPGVSWTNQDIHSRSPELLLI